jgi:RNA recognition motif-containing protein
MNIYVGNLLRTLSESELKEVFQVYGTVQTASIIKDKMTGDSRGFGFVEMPNRDEAMKAIASLNGKDLKGRNMTVNEAKPRTDGPRSGGFGGGGGRRY